MLLDGAYCNPLLLGKLAH